MAAGPDREAADQSCASISSARAAWVKTTGRTYGQRRSSSVRSTSQVTPSARSWSRVARRRSSSACCAAVKGTCASSRCPTARQSARGVRRGTGGQSRRSSGAYPQPRAVSAAVKKRRGPQLDLQAGVELGPVFQVRRIPSGPGSMREGAPGLKSRPSGNDPFRVS